MELVPWRPFGEVSSVRREMDRLWNRFLGETPLARTLTDEWLASVDISETEDKLLIKAELPGLEAKDVKDSVNDHFLRGMKGKDLEGAIRMCNAISSDGAARIAFISSALLPGF